MPTKDAMRTANRLGYQGGNQYRAAYVIDEEMSKPDPPEVKAGQLWANKNGIKFFVIYDVGVGYGLIRASQHEGFYMQRGHYASTLDLAKYFTETNWRYLGKAQIIAEK